ncbi:MULTISPECIES: aminodeoxychorismate synthase component I [Sphingomonas]|uniref:aminodeoxychorismate synthase component I n=1 Tax=Sphingomonas TaxID=13687 RepID=UPI000830FE12|nr:aminodeoxychorismate synthase component I [Sphingomonas sp. CCH10-B3]
MLSPPFILLDDARPGGAAARLYRDPVETFVAHDVDAVAAALEVVRSAPARGLHAAGYLAYEAAATFEPALALPSSGTGPLLWFGLFERFETIADVPAWLPDPAGAWNSPPRPLIDRADYDARLAQVIALINAGDLYQANLTFPAEVRIEGDPLALYARLRAASAAGYGAVIATGDETLLSLSPELFFALEGRQLTVRPMKGTARRDADPAPDRAAAAALAADPKQRAENLMIVDLMRNDLSRVAVAGSVAVPSLFAVESYPTVHQMVSTVTAELAPARGGIDVLAALFPCGSITGAPKIRAIEALAAIEAQPRGVYTGAIGRIDANGDAMFNVAIRTLRIARGDAKAVIGLGGGIVADSTSAAEWDEAHAKGAFLTTGLRGFDLIETMAFDPVVGIALLERHLARMKASAASFGFAFDRHAARNELQAATFRLAQPSRVRLVLSPSGAFAIETAPAPPMPDAPVPVAIVPLPVPASDFRLRHKTSDRDFYDAARRAADAFEVAFTDAEGFLTEGSFTSLFVERGATLLTPPLARGLLPGVLRASLIDSGRAVEADLTPADLAGGFFIGNGLRGLVPAVVAPPQRACL